ncbi:hypothetical protein [Pelagicoccus sp. SDUM812003]|uniref:hypothetical protein n=1 Tax=Pelagicoccus sp. SDUM812003 TaxID=3041267 RepID=UPI00280CD1DF|nr:hypothetical protein [Pelagicoccus sp. SDUM812003]MDQ8203038.1 hypothetical protein [Pelagicoccus sp. SDUM812003]
MPSSAASTSRKALSRALANALPFDSARARYGICLLLLASGGVALWANLAIKPKTRHLALHGDSLFELERSYLQAKEQSQDLESLREQSDAIRSRFFASEKAVDSAVVSLIEQTKARGWNAIVASVERDETGATLFRAHRYRLELSRDVGKFQRQGEIDLSTEQILAFLQTLARSESAFDIDHFEVVSDEGRSTKAFLNLVARTEK